MKNKKLLFLFVLIGCATVNLKLENYDNKDARVIDYPEDNTIYVFIPLRRTVIDDLSDRCGKDKIIEVVLNDYGNVRKIVCKLTEHIPRDRDRRQQGQMPRD